MKKKKEQLREEKEKEKWRDNYLGIPVEGGFMYISTLRKINVRR